MSVVLHGQFPSNWRMEKQSKSIVLSTTNLLHQINVDNYWINVDERRNRFARGVGFNLNLYHQSNLLSGIFVSIYDILLFKLTATITICTKITITISTQTITTKPLLIQLLLVLTNYYYETTTITVAIGTNQLFLLLVLTLLTIKQLSYNRYLY